MVGIKNVTRTQEKEGVRKLVQKIKQRVKQADENKDQTIEDKLYGNEPIGKD